jgi:predicted dehydrogenase
MGRFHAKALRDLGYFVTTVDPHAPADLKRVPDLEGYDVAAIATPPALLGFYGVHCADAGLKTLIEKPVAPSLRQVELIESAVIEAGAYDNVCVGFVERFNPKVRELRENLPLIGQAEFASFDRWGDRPNEDALVDLRIHDIDLAHFLGLQCTLDYRTWAGAPRKKRVVRVSGTFGQVNADLMDHDTSPLHALWHAFLSGAPVARLEDAIRAHRALQAPYAEAMA